MTLYYLTVDGERISRDYYPTELSELRGPMARMERLGLAVQLESRRSEPLPQETEEETSLMNSQT